MAAQKDKRSNLSVEQRRKILKTIGTAANPAQTTEEGFPYVAQVEGGRNPASSSPSKADIEKPLYQEQMAARNAPGAFKEPTYPTEDDKSLFSRIREKVQEKIGSKQQPISNVQFDDLNIFGRVRPQLEKRIPQEPKQNVSTKEQPNVSAVQKLPAPVVSDQVEAPQAEPIEQSPAKTFESYREQAAAGMTAPQRPEVPSVGEVTYKMPERAPQGEYQEPQGTSLLSQILIGLGTTAAGALVGGYRGGAAGAAAGKDIIENYNQKLSDARKAAKDAYLDEKKLRRAEDLMIQNKIADQQFQLSKEQRAAAAKAEENYQKSLLEHNKKIQDLQFKLYEAGRKQEADALNAMLKTNLANLSAETQVKLQGMKGKSAAEIQAIKSKAAAQAAAAKTKDQGAYRGLTPQQVESQIEKLGEVSDSVSKVASSIGQIESQIGFNIDSYNPESNTAVDFKGNKIAVDVPGVNIPGVGRTAFYSSKARMLNDSINKLFNEELFTRGGKAITSQELQRLKSDFSMGKFNTEQELLNALKNYKAAVQRAVTNAEARFMPEVKKEYETRGAQLPGAIVGTSPQSSGGGYTMDELLREKARRQGGR